MRASFQARRTEVNARRGTIALKPVSEARRPLSVAPAERPRVLADIVTASLGHGECRAHTSLPISSTSLACHVRVEVLHHSRRITHVAKLLMSHTGTVAKDRLSYAQSRDCHKPMPTIVASICNMQYGHQYNTGALYSCSAQHFNERRFVVYLLRTGRLRKHAQPPDTADWMPATDLRSTVRITAHFFCQLLMNISDLPSLPFCLTYQQLWQKRD